MTRILVVAPSWVGDALLSQPLLALLKQRDPASAIDILAPGWALPIYRRMPQIDQTFDSPFGHGELALRKRLQLARQLRARQYDRAYVLPNSFKSALVPLFARIAQRVGFIGEARYGLLTDARRLDERTLPRMVERFASLAFARGTAVPQLPDPRLQVEQSERDQLVAQLWLDRPARLVCLLPGG